MVPRDRHAVVLARIAIAGAGLERFATEVRNLQRTEVREVEEPFGSGQKGSSAMPHKRNPILCERITGLARVLRGYSQTGLENVALWHERDISHSGAERVVLPDATILLDYMQHLASRVAREMTVHADRMRENLELTHGAVHSQRALTALVESGMDRDAAYRIVQESAQRAWDEGHQLPGPAGRRQPPNLDLRTRYSTRALTWRTCPRSSSDSRAPRRQPVRPGERRLTRIAGVPFRGDRVTFRRTIGSGRSLAGPSSARREHRRKHDAHLELGEGGADAAPGAAAERDPAVGIRALTD